MDSTGSSPARETAEMETRMNTHQNPEMIENTIPTLLHCDIATPRWRTARLTPSASRLWRRAVGIPAVLLIAAQCVGTACGQTALTNGLAQDGAISAAAETGTWTIAATKGDRVVVQIAKLSGGAAFTPAIEILAPNGLPQGTRSGGVAARLDIQAEFTGTYTVNVTDANGTGTGTYRLRLAQVPLAFTVPTGDEGGPMTNGVSHQGTIDVGDLDLWTLSAGAGDRIVLQISKLTGGASFMPMIELFGPDGSRIGADHGVVAARLDSQAPVAGTYTVLVSDALQTGSGTYQLQLAQVPGAFTVPAGDEGGPLADGADQDGTIQLGDLDLWTFTAASGDLINLQITELTGGASFTPMIELFSPDGQRLREAQGGSGAALERVIESAGTYTVLVSDATLTGSGTYRLHLTRSTIAPLGANVLTNGGTVLGSISAAGETNHWIFPASVGNTLIVRIGKASGTTFVPWIRLLTPSGTQVGSASSSAGAEIAVAATNSGTFTVVVGDNSSGHNQTGTYRLTLAKPGSPIVVLPTDEGGPMTNGVMHTGMIDVGDLDVWNFTANAGDNLVVRMGELVSGSLTPYLRLYGPDGSLLDFASYATASQVAARATNSGTFTVVAGDFSSSYAGSGTYRLKLGKTGSPIVVLPTDEGGPLTNGVMHTGSIDVGDMDVWSFTANAGDSLVVRMGELVGGSLTPYLRLFGPDGSLLDSGSYATAAEVTARATNSGTFTVIATDLSGAYSGSGTYRLKLGKTGSPIVVLPTDEGGPMTNGVMHTGNIDVGDMDVWSFRADAGDSLVVRMGELVSSSLTPYLRLFGPDGSLLDSGSYATAAEVTARATNSGTFTVIATDLSGAYSGSGTYRLTQVRTGNPLFVSVGDEGGSFTGANSYDGTLDVGDLDAWTFTAWSGDSISLRVDELVNGSSLTPWLRLYGSDGTLLNTISGAATAQISRTAPSNGTYTVVLADLSGAYSGSGTYRLTVNGLTDGFKVRMLRATGGVPRLVAIGGVPDASFVLLSTTNLLVPVAQWTPVLTNPFTSQGVFNYTNASNPALPQQYFRFFDPN